jgi:hypothetical protein
LYTSTINKITKSLNPTEEWLKSLSNEKKTQNLKVNKVPDHNQSIDSSFALLVTVLSSSTTLSELSSGKSLLATFLSPNKSGSGKWKFLY